VIVLVLGLGSHLTQSPLGWGLPPYQVTKCQWHPDACSRLTTTEVGWKLGRGLCPLFGRVERGPHLTKSLGLRPSSIPSGILIHAAIWPQQIWAENWVGAQPLWGRQSWIPSNTMWPGPMPTCMSSFMLMRPTLWPQYTNVTDRTDNGPIAKGEPFYIRSPKKHHSWCKAPTSIS